MNPRTRGPGPGGGYESERIILEGGPDYIMPMGDNPGFGKPKGLPQSTQRQPRKPLIPGHGEIESLPRLSRVAFAARCARRVLPAYPTLWPEAPAEYAPLFQRAVGLAERISVGASAEMIEATKLAPTVYEAAADSRDPAWYSANAAANAIELAADPANSDEAAGAAQNAAALLFHTAAIDSPLTAQLRCIRRDFVRLKNLARKEKWTDDTPVPPEVFGPMWPEGVAPYWAVEVHPAKPQAEE